MWVLTGDKEETAINIAFACQLLDTSTRILVVNKKTHPSRAAMAEALRGAAAKVNRAGGLLQLLKCSLLTTHYPLLTSHYPLLTTLLTTYYSLPTTHYPLLTTHCSLPTTHCSLLTTHHPLLTTHYPLLTSHYPPPATHHPLLTVHYSVRTAHSYRPKPTQRLRKSTRSSSTARQ